MIANLFIPRRNSNSLCPSGTLNTLITVPCGGEDKTPAAGHAGWMRREDVGREGLTFSEALASLVPEALKVSAARGLAWAWISVTVL